MLQLRNVSELSMLPKRSNSLSSDDAPIAPVDVAAAVEDELFIKIVDASKGAIIEVEVVLPTFPYPYR